MDFIQDESCGKGTPCNHVKKRCPAKQCVDMLKFEVDPDLCKKCGMCFKSCPADAITWKKKEVAVIDKEKCVKCMSCFDKCRFDSIF